MGDPFTKIFLLNAVKGHEAAEVGVVQLRPVPVPKATVHTHRDKAPRPQILSVEADQLPLKDKDVILWSAHKAPQLPGNVNTDFLSEPRLKKVAKSRNRFWQQRAGGTTVRTDV